MVDREGNRRLARVSETIRSEVARLLIEEANDPGLSMVTITGVETSPDLRQARVYFVATGMDDQRPARRSLERAAPFFQREIGRNLHLRNTPRLVFHHDDSFDEAERIDRLIEEVNVEDRERREDHSAARLDQLLRGAERILVATHRNPDGDAIGSLLGMATILRALDKQPVAFCSDGVPLTLRFLPGVDQVIGELLPDAVFDATVVVDTASEELLPDGLPAPEALGELIVIDHHERHGEFGDLVIRREASAVGEIIFELARELDWPLSAAAADCLYTSIVADTGSFRYSSTTPATHRIAAELLELGARPWPVATALYESYPGRRQRLLGEVLATLELSEDGRFASLCATPEMLERCGARRADLEGMINFARSVRGVEIAAMFRLEDDGSYRVSFRSKGDADVGRLAARFDGGGHRNAAGCFLEASDMATARRQVGAAAIEDLGDHP